MKTNTKYLYHSVSIAMLAVLIGLYLVISNVHPEANTADTIFGMTAAWVLQYAFVNAVLYLEKKNLIN